MAFIESTDAAGNTLRYELPAEEGVLITLGSAEDATLRFEAEGVSPHHADITLADGQYAITPAEGAVVVNGAPIETAMLLVEGVDYAIGSLHLSLIPAAAEAREAAPAEEGAPKKKKVVRRKKSLSSTLAAATPVPTKKENPIVTMVTPFYVIAVLAAAFVAGLTLRYWLVTGGFLPAEWLNK